MFRRAPSAAMEAYAEQHGQVRRSIIAHLAHPLHSVSYCVNHPLISLTHLSSFALSDLSGHLSPTNLRTGTSQGVACTEGNIWAYAWTRLGGSWCNADVTGV